MGELRSYAGAETNRSRARPLRPRTRMARLDIRMHEDMRVKLETIAARHRRTLSAVVELALEDYFTKVGTS